VRTHLPKKPQHFFCCYFITRTRPCSHCKLLPHRQILWRARGGHGDISLHKTHRTISRSIHHAHHCHHCAMAPEWRAEVLAHCVSPPRAHVNLYSKMPNRPTRSMARLLSDRYELPKGKSAGLAGRNAKYFCIQCKNVGRKGSGV